MKTKIKKIVQNKIIKMETSGEIMEVIINEDLLNPKEETISLCFSGDKASGIIELKTKEFEKLYNTVNKKLHLVRNLKDFRKE